MKERAAASPFSSPARERGTLDCGWPRSATPFTLRTKLGLQEDTSPVSVLTDDRGVDRAMLHRASGLRLLATVPRDARRELRKRAYPTSQ
jgi:hypothetical protein